MKIALLGCGGFARVHARAIGNYKAAPVEMVAVSRDLERARAFARETGARHALAPYQAAFADPSIDAVCILTPHDTHVPLAVQALCAGKHVYIEKPVARTLAEAEPLGRAFAEAPGRVLAIGENFHFIPQVEQAAQLVREGAIGQLQMVMMNLCHCVTPQGWRTRREPMGGGVLIDGGVHVLHGLRMLAGEVDWVCAAEPAVKTIAMEGEAAVQMLLRFASGAIGTASYSWDSPAGSPTPDYALLGTGGALHVHLGRLELDWFRQAGSPPETLPVADEGDSMDRSLAAFLDAIREGKRPAVTLAEGLRDVALVEAVYRSLASGQVQRVEPSPDWAQATPDR